MCLCVSQGHLDLQKPTLFLFVLFLSCNTGDGLMRFSMNFWAAQVLHNWLVDRQVADQVSLRQLLPSPAALSPSADEKGTRWRDIVWKLTAGACLYC